MGGGEWAGIGRSEGRSAQDSVLNRGEGAFGMNPGTGRQFHTLAQGVGEIDFPWGVGKVGDVAHMGFASLMTSHKVHLHTYRDL